MTIAIITDIKKLNAAVKSVGKAGAKFEAQLHSVAYSCLAHADATGDIRPMGNLYNELSGRVLKSALVAWANAFGRMSLTEPVDGEAFTISYAKGKPGDLPTAFATPVSDFKPESAGKGSIFDLAAKLTSTIKAAGKAELTADEARALVLVTQALAILNPAVVPASNIVPIKAPAKPRKAKTAPAQEQAAA